MNIEKHRAFIDSLEGGKGLPEEWRLLIGGEKLKEGDEIWVSSDGITGDWKRCFIPGVTNSRPFRRRAESRQIPDLKEKVKELMRDAMDAQAAYDTDPVYDVKTGKQVVGHSEAEQFRALCEPEKYSKEAAR